MGPKTGKYHATYTNAARWTGPGTVVTWLTFGEWSPCSVEGGGSGGTKVTLGIEADGCTFFLDGKL